MNEIYSLSIGISREQVLDLVENPIAIEKNDEFEVLVYNSRYAPKRSVITLKDEVVVFTSESMYGENKTLMQLIEQYGAPSQSILTNTSRFDNAYISTPQTIHVWPHLGIASVTDGATTANQVERVDHFSPITLTEYLTSWGKQYARNEIVRLATSSSLPATPKPAPSVFSPPPLLALSVFVSVVVVLVIIFVIVTIKNRQKI